MVPIYNGLGNKKGIVVHAGNNMVSLKVMTLSKRSEIFKEYFMILFIYSLYTI